MSFKQIVLHLTTYPEATPVEAVDQAAEFAELLGARLFALLFEVDFRVPGSPTGNLFLDIPGMAAAEREKSAKNARDLISAFESATTKRGLAHNHVTERATSAEIPDIVTEYARLHDLTILPISEEPGFERYVAECVIFGSGRPVLVIPATSKRGLPIRLDQVGIAWDFSRPAARAVADALPLLQRAKGVRVVTVTNEKTIDTRRSGSELARHLAAHGVDVVLDEEDAAGRSIGNALEAYAAAHRLDLLVMGAYGHSRLREFILGGATDSILKAPALPVLLSH